VPIDFVDISAEDYLPWTTVLEHIHDCIKLNIDPIGLVGTRIYPYWVYEIEPSTMLGKIVPAMRCDTGTDNGKVHCWTLGIQNVNIQLNQAGQMPILGDRGAQNEWTLMIDIWGLFDYDGTKASQQKCINETRLVGAALSRNTEKFVTEEPLISFAGRPTFSAIQPTPFSDGQNYSVAVGVMQINVKEALTS